VGLIKILNHDVSHLSSQEKIEIIVSNNDVRSYLSAFWDHLQSLNSCDLPSRPLCGPVLAYRVQAWEKQKYSGSLSLVHLGAIDKIGDKLKIFNLNSSLEN